MNIKQLKPVHIGYLMVDGDRVGEIFECTHPYDEGRCAYLGLQHETKRVVLVNELRHMDRAWEEAFDQGRPVACLLGGPIS